MAEIMTNFPAGDMPGAQKPVKKAAAPKKVQPTPTPAPTPEPVVAAEPVVTPEPVQPVVAENETSTEE